MFSLLGTWDGWSMGQYGLEFSSEGRWGGGKGSGLIWLLDVFIHICPLPPLWRNKELLFSVSLAPCDSPGWLFFL